MTNKHISDLTSDEYDKLRLAIDYLLKTHDVHKFDFLYMNEDDESWKFTMEYTSNYDRPRSRRTKYLIIPVMKLDNKIGKAIDPKLK